LLQHQSILAALISTSISAKQQQHLRSWNQNRIHLLLLLSPVSKLLLAYQRTAAKEEMHAKQASRSVCNTYNSGRIGAELLLAGRQGRSEHPLSPPSPRPPPSTRGTLASTTAAYRLGQRHGLQRGLHSQVVTAHTCGKGPQASLRSPFINRKFFVYKKCALIKIAALWKWLFNLGCRRTFNLTKAWEPNKATYLALVQICALIKIMPLSIVAF
jgi:hypothetical protein